MTDIGNYNHNKDANLTVAQKLLGSIKKKMKKNKYILCATLFVLILIVAFVIYTYVGGSNSSS